MCKSSPFFWAFHQGLVMDTDMAAATFSLTDAMPGADVCHAVHRIDLNSGMLKSEVRVTVLRHHWRRDDQVNGVRCVPCSTAARVIYSY